jgi:PEP-CTERM motif
MKKLFVFAASVLLFGALTASLCRADGTSSGTLDFQTSDQSMWGSGSAFNFNYDPTLVNIPVSANADFGPGTTTGCFLGVCASAGFDVHAYVSGNVGLNANISVNGGTVNAAVPVNIGLGFPGAVPLDGAVSITSSAMFGTGSLSTASPTAQASLNAFADLSGGVTAKGCLGGCVSGGTTFNTGYQSTPIFSINSATQPSGSVDLGHDVSLTVTAPYVQTSGTGTSATNSLSISTSGSSPFLGLSADVTNLIANGLGLPPTSASFNLVPGISVGYNLVDFTAGLSLDTTQAFALNATPMVEYNVSETGSNPLSFSSGLMTVGTPFDFTFADGDTSAVVTPDYLMSATLDNNVGGALSANLGFSALGLTFPGGSAGPLINTGKTFPVTSFSVFNDMFALMGWNSFVGNSFSIMASPNVTATPEPGTLPLLLMGLLAVATLWRRRASAIRV